MENQIVLKKTQNELSFKLHVQARAYNLRISSKKLIKLLFDLSIIVKGLQERMQGFCGAGYSQKKPKDIKEFYYPQETFLKN